MTIWTIQTQAAVQQLLQTGRLKGDWRRIHRCDKPAYRWMAHQLSNRTTSPEFRSDVAPIWAWYSYFGGMSGAKPDLRKSWHLPRGTSGARIELDVPNDIVLLSQFEMWNSVLMNQYVFLSRQEKNRLSHEQITCKMISESWDRIFDLRCGSRALWGSFQTRAIQACIASIKHEHVKRIDYFVSR